MTSNILGKKLCSLRKKIGISQRDLAKRLSSSGINVTNQAVSKWESGSSLPNAIQFLAICDILGISDISGVFLGKSNELLNGLNDLGKQRIIEYAGLLRESGQYDDLKAPTPRGTARLRTLPVYDLELASEEGNMLESTEFKLVEVGNEVPLKANFGIRISGESMEPDYKDGETIWICRCKKIDHGDVGLFLYERKYYFKRLRDRVGGTRLQSIDANYPDIIITIPENMVTLGIAIDNT